MLKRLLAERDEESKVFLDGAITAPPLLQRIPGFAAPVRKDAVLYVTGGPKQQPATGFCDLIRSAIQAGAMPAPLCFLMETVPSSGRWPERWRMTVAFRNQAAASQAAPVLRTLLLPVGLELIPLQVTSLVYISTLYSRLGWLTRDVGTCDFGPVVNLTQKKLGKCICESIVADQQCNPQRVGPHPRGKVELQLQQDGYSLRGANSLGALQVILPGGDGAGLYLERLRGGRAWC